MPWEPWEGRLTERTTYVGVQRKIRFRTPFQNSPAVIPSLNVINIAPLESVCGKAGYRPSDERELLRLREIHVESFVENVTPQGFDLRAGVGLPTVCADRLIEYLQKKEVDEALLAIHRRFQTLGPNSDELGSQQKWMMNFYTEVGTLGIVWTATADQK